LQALQMQIPKTRLAVNDGQGLEQPITVLTGPFIGPRVNEFVANQPGHIR
jgi:hypothetical protein